MKKYNRTNTSEIIKIIVNAELKHLGLCYEDVKSGAWDDPKIEWYEACTFKTKKEYESWKKFTIKFLMTQVTPKFSKKRAEKEFLWIDLYCGLKQDYDQRANKRNS